LEKLELLENQLEISQDKIKMIKEARSNETRDTAKKIEELRAKSQIYIKRIAELENSIVEIDSRNIFNAR
jgi:hypothetical protein